MAFGGSRAPLTLLTLLKRPGRMISSRNISFGLFLRPGTLRRVYETRGTKEPRQDVGIHNADTPDRKSGESELPS